MSTTHHTTETVATASAKIAPPASVSLASLFGFQVSELLLWATLIYTLLMIVHKVYRIYVDIRSDE